MKSVISIGLSILYAQHLSNSKKHTSNLSVTDMSPVCDIHGTALWQFKIQTCERHITDLF